MIEGLKIEIASAELKSHLEDRAEYHRKKYEWYGSQVSTLREGGVGPTHMSNDPVASLENSAEGHRLRAAYFSFLAEHLISGETYRLSDDDFGNVELSSRYFPGLGRLR